MMDDFNFFDKANFASQSPKKVPTETVAVNTSHLQETTDHTPPSQLSQKMFAHYSIQGELGRGGMGVVYKAYDTKLKRSIALKIMHTNSEHDTKRFMTECSAMAQLKHPNIIQLYEFGESPRPYFTMEYIEGYTLAYLIKEKAIKRISLIDLLINVCDALAHAHKHRIIHRDIKPSNIMITKKGEPKVMDFGLAKKSDGDEQGLSKTGDVLGTILYMSPEQLNGKPTYQSDIYSIGATMYEALTYRNIHQGESYHSVFLQILQKDPIPPRHLNSEISPYIEAVCLKCIAKKAPKRYKNCKELVRDLKNLKAKKPIIAKKYTKWDSIANFASRNKILCSSVLTIFLVTLVALLITTNALYHARTQQQFAEKASKEKQIVNDKLQQANDSLKERNRDLKMLNKAMIEFTQKIKRSPYNGLLREKEMLRSLEVAFAKSVTLRTAEEYRLLRGLILANSTNKKHTNQAIKDYDAIIAKSKDFKVYNDRGSAYLKKKQYDKALQDFNTAISLNTRNATLYRNRSDVYTAMKMYPQALKDLKKALELMPNHADIHLQIGRIHQSRGDTIKAALSYKAAFKLAPNNAETFWHMGNLYKESKKYAHAVQSYNKAIQFNPNHSKAYSDRGTLYDMGKNYQQALADYNKAISLDSQYTNAYMNRGALFRKTNRDEEAIRDYNTAISIDSNLDAAYVGRGNVYAKKKRYNKALKDYAKAISLNNKNSLAYENRGHLYQLLGKYKLALRDFKTASKYGGDKVILKKHIQNTKQAMK